MIIGIGVDIVEVERIAQAVEGTASLQERVFTESEIRYCSERKARFQHLAGRFAAKEAALKALGTGWSSGIRWQDVESVPDEKGKPQLLLHGKAKELFEQSGAHQALVSISHTDSHAVAVVVLEK